ncbi:hypothetical protein D3C85_1309190 [compost metagenome]
MPGRRRPCRCSLRKWPTCSTRGRQPCPLGRQPCQRCRKRRCKPCKPNLCRCLSNSWSLSLSPSWPHVARPASVPAKVRSGCCGSPPTASTACSTCPASRWWKPSGSSLTWPPCSASSACMARACRHSTACACNWRTVARAARCSKPWHRPSACWRKPSRSCSSRLPTWTSSAGRPASAHSCCTRPRWPAGCGRLPMS